ncbi:hypothetical protein KU306_13005 [Haloferax larsenii]|uniref:Uncharacterized protein n=1 Tax=Haloferax larsenii TaxID=302484 RepID=A0ABY5RED3_HALLR|nr:hypothetical protein [Haloferax larsenii]UVE49823.1 hypothetical protein KU306_13005 [Haloferax larsenii]
MTTRRELLTMLGSSVLVLTAGCSTTSEQETRNTIDVIVNNNRRESPAAVTVELLKDDATVFHQFVTLQAGPDSVSRSIGAVRGVQDEAEVTIKASLESPAKESSKTIAAGCLPDDTHTEVIVTIAPGDNIEISSNGCDR